MDYLHTQQSNCWLICFLEDDMMGSWERKGKNLQPPSLGRSIYRTVCSHMQTRGDNLKQSNRRGVKKKRKRTFSNCSKSIFKMMHLLQRSTFIELLWPSASCASHEQQFTCCVKAAFYMQLLKHLASFRRRKTATEHNNDFYNLTMCVC